MKSVERTVATLPDGSRRCQAFTHARGGVRHCFQCTRAAEDGGTECRQHAALTRKREAETAAWRMRTALDAEGHGRRLRVGGRLPAAEAPKKRGRREVTVRMNAELRDALAEYILIRAGCVSDERAIRFHVSERGTAKHIRERAVGRDLSKPSARDRRFIAAVDAFETWFKEGS